jgi:hypothetical protein
MPSFPRRRVVAAATAAAALAAAPSARAQSWPDAATRIVVPYRPGTGPDLLARELADRLSKARGVPVVVENRDGGNGVIGIDAVAKAAGDGRTLLLTDSIALPVNAVALRKVPYDWRRDLKPVSPVADVDLFLYATPKRDFRTAADAIAFARANPGVLNYGVVGNGSVSHLSMERLVAHAGIRVTKVNYNGIAQVIPALVNGEIDLFVLGPVRRPRRGRPGAGAAGRHRRPQPGVPAGADAARGRPALGAAARHALHALRAGHDARRAGRAHQPGGGGDAARALVPRALPEDRPARDAGAAGRRGEAAGRAGRAGAAAGEVARRDRVTGRPGAGVRARPGWGARARCRPAPRRAARELSAPS